jgi:hypothetical protein
MSTLSNCHKFTGAISMTIYKKRTPSRVYRKIYEQHYGIIPKDMNGRSYEIHHIDGDSSNNDPSNLVALSIQEHYDIHYERGDFSACHMIAVRLGKTSEDLSQIAKKRVENGTHNFLGPETNKKRVDNGTHNFLGNNNPSHERVKNGTHNLQGNGNPTHRRLIEGTHHFQNKEWVKQNMEKRNERGTHKGKNHPMYDTILYIFQNLETSEIVISTRYDFVKSHNINQGNLSLVINGHRKSVSGWKIIRQ